MLTLLVVFVFSGVGQVILALPLVAQMVGPNYWYGFRLPGVYKNEPIWYAVNRYGGIRLALSGGAIVSAAVLFFTLPGLSVDAYALLVLGVVVLTMTLCIVQTTRYLKRLIKESGG